MALKSMSRGEAKETEASSPLRKKSARYVAAASEKAASEIEMCGHVNEASRRAAAIFIYAQKCALWLDNGGRMYLLSI